MMLTYHKLDILSLENIKKHKNISVKVKVSDIQFGKQQPNTFLLAKVAKKENPFWGDETLPARITLNLNEVHDDGSLGDTFEVIVYGSSNVKEIDGSKAITNSWVIFENCQVYQYIGYKQDSIKFQLRIKEDHADSSLSVFYKIPKADRMKIFNYKKISQIKHGERHDIFAVVKEIVKEFSICKNGNRHCLMGLIDPSCLEPNSIQKDLLFHVFLNSPNDCFKAVPIRGDIIRVRGLLGEYYKEKKYGKVFNSHCVVVFKRNENNDPVPYFEKDYTFTDQDQQLENDLHDWYDLVKDQIIPESLAPTEIAEKDKAIKPRDQLLLYKTIEELDGPMEFKLICKIVAVRILNDESAFILKVADGTRSKAYIQKICMEDATLNLNSQTETVENESPYIYITVYGKIKEAYEFLPGNFVRLHKVCSTRMDLSQESQMCGVCLDFFIKESDMKFQKLSEELQHVKILKRRINELLKENDAVEMDSRINLESAVAEKGRGAMSNGDAIEPATTECVESPVEVETFLEAAEPPQNFEPSAEAQGSSTELVICAKSPIFGLHLPVGFVKGWTCSNPKAHLCEFLNAKEKLLVEDVVRVNAKINDVKTFTNEVSPSLSPEINCLLDVVWSYCSNCDEALCPSDLRKRYTKVQLMSNDIFCLKCTNFSRNLKAIFALKLTLQHLCNEDTLNVELLGEYASKFFGTEPSFHLLVAELEPACGFLLKMQILTHYEGTLQLCLRKEKKSHAYIISDTYLMCELLNDDPICIKPFKKIKNV